MGYKRPETVYLLRFKDRDGLEVRAASVPLGQLLDVADAAEGLRKGSIGEARKLFELFSRSLRSWNLEEDDGTPVPTTLAALMGLEQVFAAEILLSWFDAMNTVPDPLAGRSTGGSPLGVPSIPMETLSASPQSWSMPS